jgi:hypothetical protein
MQLNKMSLGIGGVMKVVVGISIWILVLIGTIAQTAQAGEGVAILGLPPYQIRPIEAFSKEIEIDDVIQAKALSEDCQMLAMGLSDLSEDGDIKREKCNLQKKILSVIKTNLAKTIQKFPWCRKYGCDEKNMQVIRHDVFSACFQLDDQNSRREVSCKWADVIVSSVKVEMKYTVNSDRPIPLSQFNPDEVRCALMADNVYSELGPLDQWAWNDCRREYNY